MSNLNFRDTVALIKEAYSLEDYIQSCGIDLKNAGVNNMKGLCPFHNEKSPSFSVNIESQFYYCFGCHASGDIISFVQNFDNLDFRSAVMSLAESRGITIDLDGNDGSGVNYSAQKSVVRDTANFFYKEFKRLSDDSPAKKQVTSRGLDVSKFFYGYAPAGGFTLYNFLRKNGHTDDDILATGVCRKSERSGKIFDFWQDRLMFFITNNRGDPIGFSGRTLKPNDKTQKYVNSVDSAIYDKSASLFNINLAKDASKKDEVLFVVEGQFDVVALVESGYKNVVASSGTAFTPRQASMCSSMVGENGRVVFCFDGDSAGKKAALNVFAKAPSIHSLAYVVVLPDGMDPCDYRMKYGGEKLKAYISDPDNQKSLSTHVIDELSTGVDFNDPTDQSRFVARASKAVACINDSSLRESSVKHISDVAMISVGAVRSEVEDAQRFKGKPKPRKRVVETGSVVDSSSSGGSPDVANSVDSGDSEFEDKILENISGNQWYRTSATFISILALDKKYRGHVVDNVKGLVPKKLLWLAEEIDAHGDSKLIPESFTYPRVAGEVFVIPQKSEYLSQMDEEELSEHREFLRNMLKKHVSVIKRDILRRKKISQLKE